MPMLSCSSLYLCSYYMLFLYLFDWFLITYESSLLHTYIDSFYSLNLYTFLFSCYIFFMCPFFYYKYAFSFYFKLFWLFFSLLSNSESILFKFIVALVLSSSLCWLFIVSFFICYRYAFSFNYSFFSFIPIFIFMSYTSSLNALIYIYFSLITLSLLYALSFTSFFSSSDW